MAGAKRGRFAKVSFNRRRISLTHIKTNRATQPVAMTLTGVLALVLWIGLAVTALADNDPIATGDGFVVTQEDIANLKARFPVPSPETVDKGIYYKKALTIRLFAEEARALGLGGPQVKAKGPLTFDEQEILARLYLDEVLADWTVDEVVIQSYYRAHPERFRIDPSQTAEDKGIRPLDDDVKKEIREYIVNRKTQRIETEAFEDLKEKYHASFYEAKKTEDKVK